MATTAEPRHLPPTAYVQFPPGSPNAVTSDHWLSNETQVPHPIPNSYWATPLLLACEYPWSPQCPSTPKLDILLSCGIRTFIDLTEYGELCSYADLICKRAGALGIRAKDIEYHHFPIPDRSLPSCVEDVHVILSILRDNAARNRKTAIHCRGGCGRTGTIVGCWLIQSGHASDGEEALRILDSAWHGVEKVRKFPHCPPTEEQEEFVRNFRRRGEVE